MNNEIGCTECPYAGHIELKECPDAYTKVSQYCALYKHEAINSEKADNDRLIDADEFFRVFPELAIEPYINAPTVKKKDQRGEWMVKGQDIYCSVCNQESAFNEFGASKFSNFCPNCGADMREADNEKDNL